jgi:hypothetical protein
MLCDTCQLAVAGKSDVYKPSLTMEFVHHRNSRSFQLARESGCGICNLIWSEYCKAASGAVSILESGCVTTYAYNRRVTTPDMGVLTFQAYSTKMSDGSTPVASAVFDVMRDEGDTPNGHFGHDFVHTFSLPEEQSRLLDINHEIATGTDSLACVNLAHAWLSHCQSNHVECEKIDSVQHPLPSRVIDVGLSGDLSVRLHIPSAPQHERYLTLSHCWGNADIFKLSSGNEAELRAGIGIRRLPKTFRDAIHFTRALSVRYLWIDSLCILQDSLSDWRHQSALMGDIYRHGFCNLAATLSSDSEGGLFRSRVPNLIQPQRLPLRWKARLGEDFQDGMYLIWPTWRYNVDFAPLNKRGWVLQERVLAPRVIHFSNQIFWECPSTSACEIAPTGLPMMYCGGSKLFYRTFMATLERFSDDHRDDCELQGRDLKESARHTWWQLVSKYTECDLTNHNDILIAISGLAAIMEQALNDTYIAGLWCNTLFLDLLWSANGSITILLPSPPRSTRPRPLRAPTWSWASIQGKISQYITYSSMEKVTTLCTSYSVEIQADRDDFGEITKGRLTIRGRVCEGRWQPRQTEPRTLFNRSNFSLCIGDDMFNGFVGLDAVEDWTTQKARAYPFLKCLPLLLCTRDDVVALKGLVINPVDELGNVFTRIGIFSVLLNGDIQPCHNEYLKTYQQVEASQICII